MMRPRSKSRLLLLTLFCPILASVCLGGCTIGPKVETRYIILKPGAPGEILKNVRVPIQTLKSGEVIDSVDIGGWIVMPPEHFEALRKAVEEAVEEADHAP